MFRELGNDTDRPERSGITTPTPPRKLSWSLPSRPEEVFSKTQFLLRDCLENPIR
jgi:hypothetical protein